MLKPSFLRLVFATPRHISPTDGVNARDPIAELETWLQQLPAQLPLTRARMIGARLKAMQPVAYPVRTRLKLLELIDTDAQRLCGEIEAQLDLATLPLPPRIQHLLVATLGMLKLLSSAYLELAMQISRRWVVFGYAKPLRLTIFRGTLVAARRLELAHRAYTIGSSSTWKQLYTFQAMARERGFAADQPAGGGLVLSIEHTYAHALLLSALEPTGIAPGDLDRVRFYLQRHVRQCRFFQAGAKAEALQRQAEGLFVVSPGGHPPTPLTRFRHPLQAHHWLLDARDMLSKLQGQIDGLRLGVVPARLGLPIAARQTRYVAMLEAMYAHWNTPRSRAHGRTHFLPRTDLVAGFDPIRQFMDGIALHRRTNDAPPSPTLPALDEHSSEWGIVDESPGGFGLRYLSGEAKHVRVGEVAALRPRERASVLLCVIRRAVNRGASDFDLGIEVLAPSAIPVTISLRVADQRAPREVPVLLLPRVPSLNGRPGLLAAIDDAPPGTLVALHQHGQRLTLKTGIATEKLLNLELIPLSRV
ncbi:MAG: hypothetical protein KDF24_03455 [Rhodocyclaceae bacterium]|nr:hypothetical protein [Rhodocyclaceae bacterium]